MDKKVVEELFDSLWKKYLDLEKEIWRLAAVCEASPTEDLKAAVYNLSQVALGQLSDLEYMASQLFTGQILSNYEGGCRVKREYLHEIASNVTIERKK
jgi:hypothetical protein